jgi:penicillin-binding protein 2
LVKEVENDTIDSKYLAPKSTMVSRASYEEVVKGMRQAVIGGTCRAANIPGLDVCGKTGTAENSRGKDHSAFMGFAPMDEPKIAIAVYVENGGFGAEFGVPIGALMMEKYLTDSLTAESEKKAETISKKSIYYGEK